MEKQTIRLINPEGKKHSVRYYASDKDAAVESVYVRRSHRGNTIPTLLLLTIEEYP